jgi:hypothetical protein
MPRSQPFYMQKPNRKLLIFINVLYNLFSVVILIKICNVQVLLVRISRVNSDEKT